uniref:C-type lectin domain-containing protein n=1 Tax=Heliothis virescens TaxID=7102 RepID=A0A2A4JYM9_HELVI
MFSHTLLALFALYILPSISDGQKAVPFFRKDYTYVEETQAFYKFHSTALSRSEAKRTCALEGTSLFFPENDAEADTALKIRREDHPSTDSMILDITDIVSEGTFVTGDGRNIASVFNRWKSGEPNDIGGGEDCVVLINDGTLNDIHCASRFNFVCKRKLEKKDSCNKRYLEGEKLKHRQDYTYIEATQGFYKFHKDPLPWLEARRMCALEGASLFHPKNEAEAKEALLLWKNTAPAKKWIYSGLSDLISEGTFVTVNGENSVDVYTNWKRGQPDDFRKREDCVLMTNDGLMNDIVCTDKNSFICKKNIDTYEWNHNCNIYNMDYKLNQKTGKCYKLHTKPMDWNGANAACSAELTHLAVINDQQDADYLAKLVESTLARSIGGNYIRGLFHVGFSNKAKHGWTTVEGTPLNKNAALWWGDNVPDDSDSQQCGAMFYSGRLTPIDCNLRSLFVCEHQVKK